MLGLLAQAKGLQGAELQAKLKAADESFQAHFDAQKQEQLRAKYAALTQEQKDRVDLVVSHMSILTIPENIVFGDALQKAKLQKLGVKDDVLDWVPLIRKGAERPVGDGSAGPLDKFGLTGFAAETVLKLLKGEFATKVAESAPVSAAEKVEEAPKEEKAAFDVFLTGFKPETKVMLIKLVKDLLKLGLKESKEKVEEALKAPTLLFKTLPKDKLKELQEKLEAAGAKLDIK